MFALLLNAFEDHWLPWPGAMTAVTASCLPKWDPEEDHCDVVGPGAVWLATADMTGPIAKLS
eukprot:2063137-Pyramimonas_sp.AAC.1